MNKRQDCFPPQCKQAMPQALSRTKPIPHLIPDENFAQIFLKPSCRPSRPGFKLIGPLIGLDMMLPPAELSTSRLRKLSV